MKAAWPDESVPDDSAKLEWTKQYAHLLIQYVKPGQWPLLSANKENFLSVAREDALSGEWLLFSASRSM